MHTVGQNMAFLVVRKFTATIQCVLTVNEELVSMQMADGERSAPPVLHAQKSSRNSFHPALPPVEPKTELHLAPSHPAELHARLPSPLTTSSRRFCRDPTPDPVTPTCAESNQSQTSFDPQQERERERERPAPLPPSPTFDFAPPPPSPSTTFIPVGSRIPTFRAKAPSSTPPPSPTLSFAPSSVLDFAPLPAFPSHWNGSYDILNGSNEGSSLAVRVTFSPSLASSAKPHKKKLFDN
ncbi:hypothetical protein M5K25_013018 [Dendrobium thyrsiflorum]|uniref:Uncharacterized protein n=1 Tax=Dendrobium thyrsiflorum TaxID=117978 RepID=A0ABD0UZ73_DENTH